MMANFCCGKSMILKWANIMLKHITIIINAQFRDCSEHIALPHHFEIKCYISNKRKKDNPILCIILFHS